MSDTAVTNHRAATASLRVALVSEHASPLASLGGPDAGGQNVYVAQLAGRLARRGHHVTVYTRREDTRVAERVETPEGFTVVHVSAGPAVTVPKDDLHAFMPEFGAQLARAWREQPPDVVHAHFWMSGLAALRGAREHRVPVVQTYHALGTVKKRHQGAADTSPPQRIAAETSIGRQVRAVLATCADEVAELAAMGIAADRVRVAPCGVDADHFTPAVPADAGAGRRADRVPRRLLSVGRLVPRKGFDRAIRALPSVPDAELLIAGGPGAADLADDPEAERLRKLAADHGVADRVRLLGSVSPQDMPALMSSADLLLSTPCYEPFGIVPLEAMACGTPVVATAVGGHLDTVVDGVTGLLVPPAAGTGRDLLGPAVRGLLDDPDRRARFGAAGRERVLATYTWDRVTDRICRVYAEVVESARGTRTRPAKGALR